MCLVLDFGFGVDGFVVSRWAVGLGLPRLWDTRRWGLGLGLNMGGGGSDASSLVLLCPVGRRGGGGGRMLRAGSSCLFWGPLAFLVASRLS